MARPGIRRVAFDRTKYGRDLLIDVAWVRDMPTFILDAPHRLDFFDVMLVTRGRGRFHLDGEPHAVRPGSLLFTSPGQVREWDVSALEGICLFFVDAFVHDFLHDPSFLYGLPFFQIDPARASLRLTPAAAKRLRARLASMHGELAHFRRDSVDLLRAQLHETLLLMARDYAAEHRVPPRRAVHETVRRFVALVGAHVAARHRVADYATELGASPGYLSVLCEEYTGMTAKRYIEEALVTRARRELLHTDDSAARIGLALGFDDPSYFSRFFRKITGQTPSEFRDGARRIH